MSSIDTSMTKQDLEFYEKVPIAALKYGARKLLAKHLNIKMEIPTDDGYLPDYTGVAEILGFDYADQKNFEMKAEPTLALLDEWQNKTDATVGHLCRILFQLERLDILSQTGKVLQRDSLAWLEKQKMWQDVSVPIQDDTVSQSSRLDENSTDQYRYMVHDDVEGDSSCTFDAFVCSAEEDLYFVKELIKHLELEYKLKLCIPERDLLPGGSDSTITGNLIEKRCKRMIALMSPNYLRSAQCDFQTKFAHALSPGSRSKKVIPVKLEQCAIPTVLRHITYCDYTRTEVREWFWKRLAGAVAAPLHPGAVGVNQELMRGVMLNIDTRSTASFDSSDTDTTTLSSNC